MQRLATALCAVLVLLSSASAAGQTSSPEIRAILDRARRDNWFVRIGTDTGAIEGRVRILRDSIFRVGDAESSYGSVRSLERRGRSGGAGGRAALAAGLATGGLGFLLSQSFCDRGCGRSIVVGTVGGFSIGAALGATFGHLADPGDVTWRTEWAQPDSLPGPVPPRAGAAAPAHRDSGTAPRSPAPTGSPRYKGGFSTYVGALLWNEENQPRPLPTLFGIEVSRMAGRFEIIPISLNMTFLAPEMGLFSAGAGALLRFAPDYYAGLTAGGAGIESGETTAAPMVGVRLGAGNQARSAFRLEGRFHGIISHGIQPVVHLVAGYTVRSRQ